MESKTEKLIIEYQFWNQRHEERFMLIDALQLI